MEPRAFQDDQGGQKENQEPTEHVIDYSITISKRSIKEESDIDILDLSVKRPHKIMKIEVPSPVDIPHERSFEESYVLNSKGIQYISPFSSAQSMFEKPASLPPMSHSVLSVTSTPPIAPVMPTFRQMPSQPMSHPVLHSAQQIPIIHVPSFEHNRPMNSMSPSHQSCYSHSSSRTSPISPTELPSVFPKSPIISPVSIADSGRKNMRPFKAISIPGDMESDEEYIQYREAIMKSQERTQEKKNSNGRTKNTSSPQPEGPTSNASDGSHVKSDGNSSAATSTSDGKDASYWERRKKNNEAAKRSRDARRAKEDELAIRTSYLERENLYLRHQIQFLQRELAKVNGHIISKVEVLPPPGVMEASEEIKNNVVSYLRPDMVEDTFELCAGINNLRIDSEPADDRSNATFEGTLMDMVVKHRPRKELDSKSFWGLPPSSPPVFQRSPSIMRFLCHITPPRSHSTPHSSFNPFAEQVSPLSQRRSSWYSVVSHSSSTQSPSDTKMLMKSTSCEIIQEVIKAKERENRYSKFKRTLLESLDEMIKERSRSSKSLGNASSTLSYERFHSAYSTPGSPSKTNEMSRADLDLRSFRRASTSTPEEEKELLAKYKRVTITPKKQSPESSQNDLTPKSSKSDRSVIKTSDLSSHSWKEKDNLFISYESPSYRSPLALGSGIR